MSSSMKTALKVYHIHCRTFAENLILGMEKHVFRATKVGNDERIFYIHIDIIYPKTFTKNIRINIYR